MSNKISISVIIPTYNPGLYIFDCLNSLKAQKTDVLFEVILVFNGSYGKYYEDIVNYLELNFSHPYQVLHSEEKGVSAARNLGIDSALGEYLCFVDDDDVVSSSYLEELLGCSSCNCVAIANSYSFNGSINNVRANFLTKAFWATQNKSFSLLKFRSYYSTPCAKLFHKDIISTIRFNTDLDVSEDSLFMFTISPYIHDIKHTSLDAIYYVRERVGSATRKKRSLMAILGLTLKIQLKFLSVYLLNPTKYNFFFFLTRIAALLKHSYILYCK